MQFRYKHAQTEFCRNRPPLSTERANYIQDVLRIHGKRFFVLAYGTITNMFVLFYSMEKMHYVSRQNIIDPSIIDGNSDGIKLYKMFYNWTIQQQKMWKDQIEILFYSNKMKRSLIRG